MNRDRENASGWDPGGWVEPPKRQNAKTPWEPSAELDRLAREVIGAAIEVHRILGPGFLESVYEDALAIELGQRGIPFERQVQIPISYKGIRIKHGVIDVLVDDVLVVEIKSVIALMPIHSAQVISYLKAGAFQLALLMNFNELTLPKGLRRLISSG